MVLVLITCMPASQVNTADITDLWEVVAVAFLDDGLVIVNPNLAA